MSLLLICIINVAISILNSIGAGFNIKEARERDNTFALILGWSAAGMAFIGFTWTALIGLVLVYEPISTTGFGVSLLEMIGIVSETATNPVAEVEAFNQLFIPALMNIGWFALIIPCIGLGLVITLHSYIEVLRRGDLMSIGSAAWNTYAMTQNISSLINHTPEAGKSIGGLFKGLDGDGVKALVVVFFLLTAAVIGFVCTAWGFSYGKKLYVNYVKEKVQAEEA